MAIVLNSTLRIAAVHVFALMRGFLTVVCVCVCGSYFLSATSVSECVSAAACPSRLAGL